ncbi:MAG: glycosyltransferase family 39 protein [Anaerolineae bacterium]
MNSLGRKRAPLLTASALFATVRARAEWLYALAVAGIVVLFVQDALARALANWDTTDGDQGGYLRLALKVWTGDGFSSGVYHPLYALLLQPLAARDWLFFTHAKFFSIAIASVGLVILYVLGRRLFGPGPALLATAALAFTDLYRAYAARTEPEVLITVLFFAAWAAWTIGFRSPRWWWLAGPLAGLAYMAKGTGQFLLLGFLLVPLLRYGWRGLMSRRVWGLVGLYFVGASPLLIEKTLTDHNPFYDENSVHRMWYDSWDDRYATTGGSDVTMRTYFATHTPSQVIGRVADGVSGVPRMWLAALRLDAPGALQVMLLVAALALAVVGAWSLLRQRGRDAERAAVFSDTLWTFGALFVPTYLFFGWFMPVTASPRFELPLVPIVYLLAAALVWEGLAHLVPLAPTVAPLVALAVVVVALARGEWVAPGMVAASDLGRNAPSVAVFNYLTHNETLDEKIISGPGNLGQWPFYGLVSLEPIPNSLTEWGDVPGFIQEQRARHVVLSVRMVEKRRDLLEKYFHLTADGAGEDAITFDTLPPGWTLVFAYPGRPCTYCVFRVQP